MLAFVAGRDRRPGGDDDHRKRPGHPQRQHDLHSPGRQVRPGRPAPAARPRRPVQASGVLLPAARRRPDVDAARRPSGSRRSRSSASWGPASRSPCATWKSAGRATFWAPSKAATSRPSATSCIASCWKTRSRASSTSRSRSTARRHRSADHGLSAGHLCSPRPAQDRRVSQVVGSSERGSIGRDSSGIPRPVRSLAPGNRMAVPDSRIAVVSPVLASR